MYSDYRYIQSKLKQAGHNYGSELFHNKQYITISRVHNKCIDYPYIPYKPKLLEDNYGTELIHNKQYITISEFTIKEHFCSTLSLSHRQQEKWNVCRPLR